MEIKVDKEGERFGSKNETRRSSNNSYLVEGYTSNSKKKNQLKRRKA